MFEKYSSQKVKFPGISPKTTQKEAFKHLETQPERRVSINVYPLAYQLQICGIKPMVWKAEREKNCRNY